MRRTGWWLLLGWSSVAAAEDANGDGCVDAYAAAAPGACVAPSATLAPSVTVGAGSAVGAGASLGADLALGEGVVIAPKASIGGRVARAGALPIGDGAAVGRRTAIGTDPVIGAGTTFSRGVTAGSGLTTEANVGVGYAATLGDGVTLRAGAQIGNLTRVGDHAIVGAGARVGRDVTVLDALLAGAGAELLGNVGPGATIGADAEIALSAKVRRGATVEGGARVLGAAVVGRGATVGAGAILESGAVVAAGATVCEGATMGATDRAERGGTFPAAGCTRELALVGGVRRWSDGTVAASCDAYRHPASGYSYAGAVGDGLYRVDPTGSNPMDVYCEMTRDGGGWMKLFSSHWPKFWSTGDWQALGAPADANYSMLGQRALFAPGGTYELRLEVGNGVAGGTWDTEARAHYTVWTQGHDPFGQTTNGSDYTLIAGEGSVTCDGFNGLHHRLYAEGYDWAFTSDVDSGDAASCWWQQIVPTRQYSGFSGYLEGFGGNNSHVWQSLWIKGP